MSVTSCCLDKAYAKSHNVLILHSNAIDVAKGSAV